MTVPRAVRAPALHDIIALLPETGVAVPHAGLCICKWLAVLRREAERVVRQAVTPWRRPRLYG